VSPILIFEKRRTLKTLSLYKTFISKHTLDLKNCSNLGSALLSPLTVTAMKETTQIRLQKRNIYEKILTLVLTKQKVCEGGEKPTGLKFSRYRGEEWERIQMLCDSSLGGHLV
jgi:hypothetical protein